MTVGWLQAAATAGARDGLAVAEPSGRALQLATRMADGSAADAQDATVQQVLAGLLDGVPHQVAHDVRTEPLYTTATGTPVTIAATWRVTDPDAAVWLGDPATLTGSDGAYPGPVVVSQETLDGLDTDPFARWTVVPDGAAVTPEHLPALAALAAEVERGLGETRPSRPAD